jgi:protein-S-isoprenylcysteine O-methyltransferase Ste14
MNLIFRVVIGLILAGTFFISAFYRRQAREIGGTIKRQEEGWLALTLRMVFALPLLLVLLLNIFYPTSLSWSKFHLPFIFRIAGAVVAGLCVPWLLWAFRSIGKNITETVLIKDTHELVTSGPYKWIRHPLYSGALILLFSVSLVFEDWILFSYSLAGLIAFRLLVIPAEEQMLLDAFGEEYECYQSRTGALLPWFR